MTVAGETTHPNGVKFEYVTPRKIVRDIRGRIMGSTIDLKANRGVRITYPANYPEKNLAGLTVFKSNGWYE